MKTLEVFFFFHLQLRFLHLLHIYMQNENLCTRDPDIKRERIRRSLEAVWWQFCSVTVPPSTKLTLWPWGITVPCQCYSCTCNSIPILVRKDKSGTGVCWTSGAWCQCLLHYQKSHCCPSQSHNTLTTNSVGKLVCLYSFLLSLSLLSCTDTHSKLWSIRSYCKIKF